MNQGRAIVRPFFLTIFTIHKNNSKPELGYG